MSGVPRVTVICALPSEAAPLVETLRLRPVCDTPFRMFEGAAIRVVISGVGAHASAAAVGFAGGVAALQPSDIWLNVGIAGHRTLAVGSPVLAHKVASATSAQAWYPSLLFEPPCPTATVVTHDAAVTDYPDDACCDMEAAGFMTAAGAVAGGDLAQVLKIVSDNAESGLERIDRAFIRALLTPHVALITRVIDHLREVARTLPALPPAGDLDPLLARWRFSGAERAQLRQLRRRHAALAGRAAWADIDLDACRDAREALAALQALVDALPLHAAPLP